MYSLYKYLYIGECGRLSVFFASLTCLFGCGDTAVPVTVYKIPHGFLSLLAVAFSLSDASALRLGGAIIKGAEEALRESPSRLFF